jgi:hypothetical protein
MRKKKWKWGIPLNEFGSPAPCDSLLLTILESWEDGDYDTEFLEYDYHTRQIRSLPEDFKGSNGEPPRWKIKATRLEEMGEQLRREGR